MVNLIIETKAVDGVSLWLFGKYIWVIFQPAVSVAHVGLNLFASKKTLVPLGTRPVCFAGVYRVKGVLTRCLATLGQ